jgi:hypothetical protein
MHGLNGKADRLLAEAAALKAAAAPEDPRIAAYWREHRRRWEDVVNRLFALIPDDLAEAVEDNAVRAMDAHGRNDAGGFWDWHRSLLWCHSTLPDGLGEAAVRSNLARFLAYDCTQMTATCYTCGLCTTAPWVGLANPNAWRDGPRGPCLHCGGTDLVLVCEFYRRPKPPWYDNWSWRFQFCPEPDATSGEPQ